MRNFKTIGAVLMAAGFIGVTGMVMAENAKTSAPDEKFGKIFAAKCASCHGKDGKGKPAMAKVFKVEPAALDLTTETVAEKKNEDLDAITAEGKGKMPAYKGKLTPAEISGLSAYIKALAPK